jgi:predicted RNA-binding Zn-ribbon protein involved in translation (DUF1610 family)
MLKPNWRKPGPSSASKPQDPCLNPQNREHDAPSDTNTWQDLLRALTGVDLTVCPNCGQGRIIRTRLTGRETAPAPPIWDSS